MLVLLDWLPWGCGAADTRQDSASVHRIRIFSVMLDVSDDIVLCFDAG